MKLNINTRWEIQPDTLIHHLPLVSGSSYVNFSFLQVTTNHSLVNLNLGGKVQAIVGTNSEITNSELAKPT